MKVNIQSINFNIDQKLSAFIQKRMKQDPENLNICRSHPVGLPLKSGTWLHSRRNPFHFLKTNGQKVS